ncbi:alpha/beta hydrolase fold domain-containing protein [Bacteroides sp. CR5/BHMF/2]|nr:alpha/beta hydrolase fold domain-containing protein [Bacteroides sp. CR5/BHMF/2]
MKQRWRMRWQIASLLCAISEPCSRLGIDPLRIIVMGDSAGAHLSACMGTVTGFDDPNDDLQVSDAPDMAILCNPLTDFTQSSFIKVVIGGEALKKNKKPDIESLSLK